MKRKVCVVTGTRAEYGLMRSVIMEIKKSSNLELQLVVTGMHLEQRYGFTVNEIRSDGLRVDAEVKACGEGDLKSNAKSVGEGLIGFVEAFSHLNPDIILLMGDRGEALAAVVAAAYLNIPIAHLSGGDVSGGGLDEPVRHANSKFASIHFPATKTSAERLEKMGEEKWRIHIVGDPGLDTILNEKIPSKEDIEKELGLKFRDTFVLLIQHPISTEPEKSREQIAETLKAINELQYQTIIVYPNSDAGSNEIIEEIEKMRNLDYVRIYKNISHLTYLGLLRDCKAMIGNSSGGLVEAPSFKKPVINIGSRQEGRERGENVINVPYDNKEIVKAMRRAFSPEFQEKLRTVANPYGEGNTAKKICTILEDINLNKKLIQKRLSY
jgi:UDP-N-acetylglucosamine 2-epimerase (non-hydrolysing)/GDP/UDP-N,N'-diacetylbacillosamine 2-epimerase (hydrolysing)